jgi:two-component system LytT family response regulator
MLNAIIIEDEHHAATLLEAMIRDSNLNIQVLDKCTDLPSGVKRIKKSKPDIVFLDIELPVYSGIELLNFFDPDEINFHIIFTTASNEYAMRAFEMSAIDYLMKPIQEEKLRAAIEKIIRKPVMKEPENLAILKNNLHPAVNKKMVVPVANGYEIINLDEINYF